MVRALWSLHLLLLPGTRTKELEEVSQAVSSHSGSGCLSLSLSSPGCWPGSLGSSSDCLTAGVQPALEEMLIPISFLRGLE